MPTEHRRLWQSDNRQAVAFLVTYQHLGLHPVVVQGHHQTVGGYCCPTRPFTGIHNQDPHDRRIYGLQSSLLGLTLGFLLGLLSFTLSLFLSFLGQALGFLGSLLLALLLLLL